MIQQIKQLRVRIDGLIKENQAFIEESSQVPFLNTDLSQVRAAEVELLLAKSWLGRLLGELNTDNPYPVVQNAADIPPTADTADDIAPSFTGELMFLNNQREQLKGDGKSPGLMESVRKLSGLPLGEWIIVCRQQAWVHLNNACTYYGFALGRLRDETIKQNSNVA